jgi:hypothetical protein
LRRRRSPLCAALRRLSRIEAAKSATAEIEKMGVNGIRV